MKTPPRVIALEEAFWILQTREMYPTNAKDALDRVSDGRLGDVGEARIC